MAEHVEATWTFLDRTGWGSGPWDEEPYDKVQWTDAATGYPCLAVRTALGVWCGYVGVLPGHVFYKRAHTDFPAFLKRFCRHLSFSGFSIGEICRLHAGGDPDSIWWFGGMIAHAGGRIARFGSEEEGTPLSLSCRYCPLAYVQAACGALAAQLADLQAHYFEGPVHSLL